MVLEKVYRYVLVPSNPNRDVYIVQNKTDYLMQWTVEPYIAKVYNYMIKEKITNLPETQWVLIKYVEWILWIL